MTLLGYLRLFCWLHMARDPRVSVHDVHALFDAWADSQIRGAVQ